MDTIIFEPRGIAKIIDALKNSSSAGVDGINAKILKNTKEHCSVMLSLLFQHKCEEHRWASSFFLMLPGVVFFDHKEKYVSLTRRRKYFLLTRRRRVFSLKWRCAVMTVFRKITNSIMGYLPPVL
ncbi:uncharacterized protein LOC144120375 [Amblyomma americanum]